MNTKKKMLILSGSGASYDASYQAWLTQVQADTTFTPSASLKLAQSNFIAAWKAISAGDLWTNTVSWYFFHCGDTTVGRRNVKDITTYRNAIVGAGLVFAEGAGTKSEGVSYFSQPLKITDWANAEINTTIAQYCSESSTDVAGFQPTHGFETNSAVSRYLYLQPMLDATHGDLWNSSLLGFNFANANHKKRYITTYDLGATLSVIYLNASKQSTVILSPAGTSNLSINRFILSVNNNGSPVGFYLHPLAYDIVIKRAVTDVEAAAMDAAMAAYNTAVGF